MRVIFTLTFVLLWVIQLFAQERTISGTLTSSDGSPLPGINISIKGAAIGTTTDQNGYYEITVPVGATLVFSFIGMQTKEILVTEDNFQNPSSTKKQKSKKRQKSNVLQPIPRSLYTDTVAEHLPGVAVLTDETPSYHPNKSMDPTAIRAIKKRLNRYTIITDNDLVKRTGFGLQLSTFLGIERINKLPSLQNEYTQGRPEDGAVRWRGAEHNEIFSWGPLIRTLEFDGSDYSFDKNGKLVQKGTGNGQGAIAYNPMSFFKTGTTHAQELILTLPGPKGSTIIFDVENRGRSSVIPNSVYRRINFSGSLKNFNISDKLRATFSASLNHSEGNLMNRGANLSSIVGGAYRTPASFDNTNGIATKTAYTFKESYQLPDGTGRSHAPSLIDNPNGLVSELPDHERIERFLGALNLNYYPTSRFSLNFNGNVDYQWNNNVYGVPVGSAAYENGRLTDRNEDQTFISAIITPSYHTDLWMGHLKASLSYHTQFTERQFNRIDGFNFENTFTMQSADSMLSTGKSLSRISHEIILNAQYEFNRWLNIRFSNRSYFSSTNPSNGTSWLFPTGSISADLMELLSLWDIDCLRSYVSLSRTLREAPLLYSDRAYNTTLTAIQDYASYFENTELFYDASLLPETERKFETGIRFSGIDGFNLELVYFNNRTNQFTAPVRGASTFELKNIATIKNYGVNITTGYTHYHGNVPWGMDFVWSRQRSFVDEIYGANERVTLAGFTETQTVLAPGKPFGAIYGTSYKRNDEGTIIIGNDGFPLEDTNPKMIGNPQPDWTLGWSSFVHWRQFRFSILIDLKKGGEVWNGTNAALDYLGKSVSTGHLRNTSNFVFEGVNESGTTNIQPVNFNDPLKPITQNRWVRYGWDGIGEAYVEDASWIRLNEITLTYTTRQSRNRALIKNAKFSVTGHNLFLITPYTGVDPATTLFGYSTGNGLDLFNAPATRRYSAQITFKI